MKPGPALDGESGKQCERNSGSSAKTAVVGVVCAALILAIAFLWKSCWQAPADAVQQVLEAPGKGADSLVNAALKLVDGIKDRWHFTPKVVQNTQVIVQESTPTLELATVTRRMTVEMGYTNQWAGSAKSLKLRGTFLAKGGFNLRKHSEVRVLPEQRKILVILPDPEVLSIEMVSHEILWSEDGYWNKLRPEDQKIVVDQLYAKASQNAASTVLQQAKQELENSISDLSKGVAADVEVRYGANGADVLKSPRG